jgi:hypothetical protein
MGGPRASTRRHQAFWMNLDFIPAAFDPASFVLVTSTLVAFFCVWTITRGLEGDHPIGARLGLHLHVLLFYGLGGLSYAWAPPIPDHLPTALVLYYMAQAMVYMTAGFGIVFIGHILNKARKRQLHRIRRILGVAGRMSVDLVRFRMAVESMDTANLFWIAAPLSIFGYLLADSDIAKSGIGTFLIVFQLLLYPITTVAVAIVGGARKVTSLFAIAYLIIVGYLVLFSPWRSHLVIFLCAVVMGVAIRSGQVRARHLLFALLGLGVVLPFAIEKKLHYEDVIGDPVTAVTRAIVMSPQDRLDALTDFWGFRIDGAREAAYVMYGLETGRTTAEDATTYRDAAAQLVPRAIWPDKPSFNQTAGYYLPRDIGLVGREDYGTSWAVDFFAEAGWNFGFPALLWFIPLAFAVASLLDWLCERFIRVPALIAFLKLVYFFQMLSIAQVNVQSTYVVWTFLVGLGFDMIIRSRHEASRLRRDPLAA